jgi:hypothetical protein
MGHVVIAAPTAADWRLLGPIVRRLLQRGHQASIVTDDPFDALFFRHQAAPVVLLRVKRSPAHDAALAPFANLPDSVDLAALAGRDLALAGEGFPVAPTRFVTRCRRRLVQVAAPLRRFLELERPDLLLVLRRRDGLARLAHELAVATGCDTLHLGDGVLPGLMQWNSDGVDGDASILGRDAEALEGEPDEPFLTAALAALLGEAAPPAIAERPIRLPDTAERVAAAWQAWRNGLPWRRIAAGLRSMPRTDERPQGPLRTPPSDGRPHVVVLLQDLNDARLRLDTDEVVRPDELLRTTAEAVRALDPELRLVVVDDRANGRPLPGEVHCVRVHGARAAVPWFPAAAAVVTINHPLAGAALLCRTPVLHLGDAIWAMAPVTRRTRLESLGADLRATLAGSGGASTDDEARERLLTTLLRRDHVWCDPDAPDPNGVRGIVAEIEERIAQRRPASLPLRYRPGPVWPLAVPGQRRR